MNKRIFILYAFITLFCSKSLFAQSYSTNVVGYIEKGADVNFTEIANYYKAHPTPLVRKPVFDEDGEEERPVRPVADPSMVHFLLSQTGGRTAETPHTAYLPASPAPADTFQAKLSDGTSIPPDTHGDIDSTYCVTAINTSITIQLRSTHAVVSSVILDNFWTSMLSHGAGSFDPRVHYDPHYKRWIMVCDAYGQSANSQIMIAVSATNDPTGAWHMYKLVVGSGSGTWLDYPNVGYNKRWIAVSGNFFNSGGSFTNDVVYVFDYASMMAGGTMSFGTLLPTGGSFTICPAQTFDTAENNLFCMENYNGAAGQVQLWKITGAIGSGLTLTSVGMPTTATFWQSSGPGGGADFAPQTGTTYKLQANDDRIHSCKQRNGSIWCAHTIFLPATGSATRASSMWWQTDTLANPIQNGLIDDPTGTAGHNFYFFPSIAVNVNNDVLIGFAQANSNIHPSCAYALHLSADAAGTWRPIYTFRHGQMAYYQTFGGPSDRWGDYSATCVDPRNNVDFWTIQESVPTYTGGIANSLWDTWWAYVKVCTSLSAPVAGVAPAGPCSGTSVLYTVPPVTGATSYTWTVTGTGWSGTSTTDSINLLVGTGIATVSVIANNSCTTSTAYTFTVSPTLMPTTPTVSLSGPIPCSGATSANYIGASTGATSYNWTVLGTGWSGTSTTSTITVTLGTGSGTIICKGTNACGSSAPDTLIQSTSPLPALPVVTPPASLCSGASALYTAVSSGATSYHWSITGTGWSGASTTGTITATVGTGAGQIIVYGINTCGNGTPDTINVSPTLIPGLPSITLSGLAPCTGATSANYVGASSSASSYTWTVLGTGWSGTSTTSAITVTIGTGSGTVICKGSNACGNSSPDTILVTPGAFPALPVVTPPTTTPCAGSAIYTATSTGASTYSWTVTGTGWSGSSTTGTLNATVGTGTGQIIVYGTNACGNGPADTLNVTPNTVPSTPVISLSGPLPCTGTATTATYNAASIGATSFTWSVLGTGWSGSSTTNSINVTFGTGTGTIICQSIDACGSSIADTVYVTSSPLPTTPSLLLSGSIPCITSTSAQYVANSIGALNYNWTVLGSGWSGTSTTDTINLTVGTGTATIICSGTNACGTSANDTVYLTPTSGVGAASGIMSTSGICEGSTATFITSSIVGAASYVWVVTGTGWSGSSTTTMITLTVGTSPATISVYGTGSCGSGASYTLFSVVPILLPTATFTEAAHIEGLGVNDLITYTGSATGTGSYSWNFGGGVAVPGIGMGPHLVSWSSTGLKTISLSVVDSGCTSVIYSDTVLVVTTTELNNLLANTSTVNIVPNPNDGAFNLVFDYPISNTIIVRITDVQGKIVYENNYENAQNKTLTINIKQLPNAVYTATIITEGNVVNKKVIICR